MAAKKKPKPKDRTREYELQCEVRRLRTALEALSMCQLNRCSSCRAVFRALLAPSAAPKGDE